MKKTTLTLACALLTLPSAVFAQGFTIPDRIEKLSEKAKETVNITLDGAMLQLAGQFLSNKDKDQAVVKNLVSRLKAIRVRSFEFDQDGQFADTDLDPIRAQLKTPLWVRVIESREKHEHTQIFLKQDNGVLGGVVILSTEPRELTIVSIDGPIDLKQLSSLGGSFGIPAGLTKE